MSTVSLHSSQAGVCGYRRFQKHIVTVILSLAVWSGPIRSLCLVCFTSPLQWPDMLQAGLRAAHRWTDIVKTESDHDGVPVLGIKSVCLCF